EHQAYPDTGEGGRFLARRQHDLHRGHQPAEVARVRGGINLELQPSRAFFGVVFGRFADDPAYIFGGSNCLSRGVVSALEMRPVAAAFTRVFSCQFGWEPDAVSLGELTDGAQPGGAGEMKVEMRFGKCPQISHLGSVLRYGGRSIPGPLGIPQR